MCSMLYTACYKKQNCSLTGFFISVGLALGVKVGIQKLGSFGLFPFTPAPLEPLALEVPPLPASPLGVLVEDGIWTVPGSTSAMLLILGAVNCS